MLTVIDVSSFLISLLARIGLLIVSSKLYLSCTSSYLDRLSSDYRSNNFSCSIEVNNSLAKIHPQTKGKFLEITSLGTRAILFSLSFCHFDSDSF